MIAFSLRSVTFPASGYRAKEAGKFVCVGEFGYSWSSSATGSGEVFGGYFQFSSNAVILLPLLGQRGAAIAVRCVQAFTIYRLVYSKYKVESVAINWLLQSDFVNSSNLLTIYFVS